MIALCVCCREPLVRPAMAGLRWDRWCNACSYIAKDTEAWIEVERRVYDFEGSEPPDRVFRLRWLAGGNTVFELKHVFAPEEYLPGFLDAVLLTIWRGFVLEVRNHFVERSLPPSNDQAASGVTDGK